MLNRCQMARPSGVGSRFIYHQLSRQVTPTSDRQQLNYVQNSNTPNSQKRQCILAMYRWARWGGPDCFQIASSAFRSMLTINGRCRNLQISMHIVCSPAPLHPGGLGDSSKNTHRLRPSAQETPLRRAHSYFAPFRNYGHLSFKTPCYNSTFIPYWLKWKFPLLV